MLIPIPSHYGWIGSKWPPGTYWIAEHVRLKQPRLFWMDDPDKRRCSGWSFTAEFAAGFATEEDVRRAFEMRGDFAALGGEVVFVEHIWDAPPKTEAA